MVYCAEFGIVLPNARRRNFQKGQDDAIKGWAIFNDFDRAFAHRQCRPSSPTTQPAASNSALLYADWRDLSDGFPNWRHRVIC